MKSHTIAAISTAVAPSGIGIVRISGERAFDIGDKVFRSPNGKKKLSQQPSHTVHFGFVYDGEDVVDEVLVTVMRAPHSFTAEDTIEINCHGGVYAVRKVLETVIKQGARPADPGEFTKKAFLNGRIDLSQAEAVMDIIEAKNEYALKNSIRQLRGSVLNKIKKMRADIIYHIAKIESALDDPEHISLEGYSEILSNINDKWIGEIERIIASSENGKILTEGVKTVIVGKPNAGKSSLLNLLSGSEKAIVTDIAGTTRDVLEENIQLDGMILNLMDTAGIRNTNDTVEKIGVDRAKECVQEADLILYVVDSSTKLDENDESIMDLIRGKKGIILLNKSDLDIVTTEEMIKKRIGDFPIISVSAKEEKGIENLEDILKEILFKEKISFNDEIYITNVRQRAAFEDAKKSLLQVKQSIENQVPEDFYTIDLMSAYESLGSIIGENVEDDLVNEIFSRFCMGK